MGGNFAVGRCLTVLSPCPAFPQIWRLVKSSEVTAREGKGLTEHRFRLMLRLIALAQVRQGMHWGDAAFACLVVKRRRGEGGACKY